MLVVVTLLLVEVAGAVELGEMFEVKESDEEEGDDGKLRAVLGVARLQKDWARVSAETSSEGQSAAMHDTTAAGNSFLGSALFSL